jgi:hypothetical protein
MVCIHQIDGEGLVVPVRAVARHATWQDC